MAQKLQTLFDDLADNIERLADYETQANQYGAAEDAFDCIAVIKIRMENLLDDARTAAAHKDVSRTPRMERRRNRRNCEKRARKAQQILNVEGQIMSSLRTSIEELKARIAVLIVATHSNGAHGIALDAFENVKNIEHMIAGLEKTALQAAKSALKELNKIIRELEN